MQKLAFIVAVAALFGALPWTSSLPPLPGAALLVGLSVGAALVASSRPAALAISAGAIGALGAGLLFGPVPALASALLLAGVYAERSSRVRGRGARAGHIAASLFAGAVAGSLAESFAGAALSTYAVALVVAAVLSALPLLVEADDPLAHELEAIAATVREPARGALLEGAELRRAATTGAADAQTAKRVQASWASLLRLGEARAKLERNARPPTTLSAAAPALGAEGEAAATEVGKRSPAAEVSAMLDRQIADHVAALTRAYSAADTVHAAQLGLDDEALRRAETVGESLEEVGRAIVEVKGPLVAALRGPSPPPFAALRRHAGPRESAACVFCL
ncbi:MAG: hypothetical protein MUF34_22510 [Polyangiaceae bacterium]|nr:hypothetical protein [Polyangiaceae bacterium]